MNLNSMDYGYDAEKVENLVDDFRKIIWEAQAALRDYNTILKVCDDLWSGQAKENFKTNLKKDAGKVSNELENLYAYLYTETVKAAQSMQDMDSKLISRY